MRFRPILMTSLAAILGLAPLAFGVGPGAQMQQPLAIMVIGGLTANMLFTRMMIPVGYLVLERTRRKGNAALAPVTAIPLPPLPPEPEPPEASLLSHTEPLSTEASVASASPPPPTATAPTVVDSPSQPVTP